MSSSHETGTLPLGTTPPDHQRQGDQAHSHTPTAPFILKGGMSEASPFLFAVPHSGRHYPSSFRRLSQLSDHQLRLSEDAFVDDLFAGVTETEAGLLVATHARAYVDLNRASNELDPTLFNGPIDDWNPSINNRVKAGLGVIPKIVNEGLPIYEGKLPVREAAKRLSETYDPYHDSLTAALKKRRALHGRALLIDCHSMPSGIELGRLRRSQPDIVLGDCWGASCTPRLISLTERLFLEEGFRVRRNIPYAGGHITRHYGRPAEGWHALQIEINRRLYMDEEKVEKLPHFPEVVAAITRITAKLLTLGARLGLDDAAPTRSAAE